MAEEETNSKNKEAAAADSSADKQEQIFKIQRIYLKDVSYESPQTPQVFANNTNWQPVVYREHQT